MIVGALNKLAVNEATLMVAVQQWIDRECVNPPKVTAINYISGGTFDIILNEPKKGDK